MPQQPATTMARWACGNGHSGQRRAKLEASDNQDAQATAHWMKRTLE